MHSDVVHYASTAKAPEPPRVLITEGRLQLYRALLLVIIVAGVACRIIQYAAKTSLWHDEALVTLNVMHRTAGELVRPLDYGQAAPPVFLWIERAMLKSFGFGEYQLRLLSLLCGICAVPLFALLAWRLFPAPVAVAVVALFAFCDKLIWHSAEVKQYSSDVFAAVLLLFLAVGLRRPTTAGGRLLEISIVGALLLWFSFPAIFVFAAISLMMLPRFWYRGGIGIVLYAAFNLLVLGSFLALYLVNVQGHDPYLEQYWLKDFVPWTKPWRIPDWLIGEIYRLCDHPYRSFGWLVLPLAVFGIVRLLRTCGMKLVWACAGPMVLCLAAAALHRYPFTGDRITLFLVPGLFLLVGAGLEFLRTLPNPIANRAWPVAVAPMLLAGLWLAGRHTAVPHSRSEIRPIVQYVKDHRKPGEAIYLVGEGTEKGQFNSGRSLELLCYWPDVPQPVHTNLAGVDNIPESRFWIVFAALPQHGSSYMDSLLDQCRARANEVDHHLIPGGGAFLYEKR